MTIYVPFWLIAASILFGMPLLLGRLWSHAGADKKITYRDLTPTERRDLYIAHFLRTLAVAVFFCSPAFASYVPEGYSIIGFISVLVFVGLLSGLSVILERRALRRYAHTNHPMA